MCLRIHGILTGKEGPEPGQREQEDGPAAAIQMPADACLRRALPTQAQAGAGHPHAVLDCPLFGRLSSADVPPTTTPHLDGTQLGMPQSTASKVPGAGDGGSQPHRGRTRELVFLEGQVRGSSRDTRTNGPVTSDCVWKHHKGAQADLTGEPGAAGRRPTERR